MEPQSRTGMGETIYPSDVAGDPRVGLGTIERQFFSESEILSGLFSNLLEAAYYKRERVNARQFRSDKYFTYRKRN